MRRDIFNLKDPFEKAVYKRLKEHMSGNDCDYVLASMARDFPFMPDEVRIKCEQAAFEHYHTNAKGKTFARLIWMTLVHSNDIGSPMHSQLCDTFHIKEGEDIYVAFEVENPLYGIGQAHVNFAAEVYCMEMGRIKTRMNADQFRKTYFIPLKLAEAGIVSDEKNREDIQILLVDKNVKGLCRVREAEVFYGDKGAKDVFYDFVGSVHNQYDEARKEFFLDQYGHLRFHSSFRYNGDYGSIGGMTGIVTIAPEDPENAWQKTVRPIRITLWDGPKAMYQNPDGGLYQGFISLVGKVISETDINRPVYEFKVGKYQVCFYVWGELVWTGEIEFSETQCEADRFLDEYIRKVNAEENDL